MSKKHTTYHDFEKYFGNNSSNADKHAFEKDVMRDAFEYEAYDGLSQLSSVELKEDIEGLKTSILKRQKPKMLFMGNPAFRAAASIVILIGFVGTFLIFRNHPKAEKVPEIATMAKEESVLPDSGALPVKKPEALAASDKTTKTTVTNQYTKPAKAIHGKKPLEKSQRARAVQADDLAEETQAKNYEALAMLESIEAEKDKFTTDLNQDKITGIVTDRKGNPIVGANIWVEGTLKGDTSDLDGNFTIGPYTSQDVINIEYEKLICKQLTASPGDYIAVSMRSELAIDQKPANGSPGNHELAYQPGVSSNMAIAQNTSQGKKQGAGNSGTEKIDMQETVPLIDSVETFHFVPVIEYSEWLKYELLKYYSDMPPTTLVFELHLMGNGTIESLVISNSPKNDINNYLRNIIFNSNKRPVNKEISNGQALNFEIVTP